MASNTTAAFFLDHHPHPAVDMSNHLSEATTMDPLSRMMTSTTVRVPFFDQTWSDLGRYSNLFIFILGLFTNPLVIVILSTRKIGSQATRVFLIFLAVSDMGSIIIAFVINYVPYYWGAEWFPVFTSDFSCGFANMAHATVNTMSSWYIVLMTAERFAVVCFPMRTKGVFTKWRTIFACCIVPIVGICVYSPFFFFMGVIEFKGYKQCVPKHNTKAADAFKALVQFWILLYFFIPASIIVILNIVILSRLKRAKKIHRTVARAYGGQSSISMTAESSVSYLSSVSSVDVTVTGDTGASGVSQMSEVTRSHLSSIRKGTRLVILASLMFVFLMLPRGISVTIYIDVNWNYDNIHEYGLDIIAYILQYLNHSTNFFLYVLAHKKFRFSS